MSKKKKKKKKNKSQDKKQKDKKQKDKDEKKKSSDEESAKKEEDKKEKGEAPDEVEEKEDSSEKAEKEEDKKESSKKAKDKGEDSDDEASQDEKDTEEDTSEKAEKEEDKEESSEKGAEKKEDTSEKTKDKGTTSGPKNALVQAKILDVAKALKKEFGDAIISSRVMKNQEEIIIDADKNVEIVKFLRDSSEFEFNTLLDATAIDYLERPDAPERFCIVYHLFTYKHSVWVRLKAYVSEEVQSIDTLIPLYKSANWLEREIHDMFGLKFNRHPDHRRLLMPQDYPAFPLRKDYPLQGRGERDDFEKVI